MKITKLPGVDDEILLELLSNSIHTGQDLLEYTSSEELMKTLENELLTLEELRRLREIAWEMECDDEKIPKSIDSINPDLRNMLYSIQLNTGDLPGFSKYLSKELLEMPIRYFRDACSNVLSRRGMAEIYELSEKTINKLLVYIDLLETYEEDREKLYIDFTRSLFIELESIADVDTNRALKLREKSVHTIDELEDILSSETKQIELTKQTGYSKVILTNILKKASDAELLPETPEEIKTRLSIDPLRIIYRYLSLDNDKIEEIWKNNASPRTLKAFQEMTQTVKAREEIAKRAAMGGNLEVMATVADLLSIPAMTPWDAWSLCYSGKDIDSVKSLAKIEFICDGIIQDVSFGTASTSRIIPYIIAARKMDTGFESRFTPPDPVKPTPKETIQEGGRISLSEMLTQLGKGIGQAQRELDLNALEMQKEILANRDLSEYGLQPTWFTMPEIDFSLKMEYDVTGARMEEGTLEPRHVDITPMNAKYKIVSGTSIKEESSLTIKFVPVPPIEAFVQRREVPDMIGMTVEETEMVLAERGIKAILYTALNLPFGFTASDDKTEVTHQSIEPGEYLGIGERLFVLATYRKRVQSA